MAYRNPQGTQMRVFTLEKHGWVGVELTVRHLLEKEFQPGNWKRRWANELF